MATKARQQYFADEDSLQKIRREFSIADDIQQKIDSIEEGAQVNVIETVKVNGTALVPDVNKAVNVEVPEVIDNLYTVDSDNALSAKQGKLLYDYIQNIASRGRFLSNWNSATGLPTTNPSESPYPYKSGDYFNVSNVASSGGTNYRPDGSSYIIGQASTVIETEDVNVSDFYFYDGTNWLLLSNSGRQIAIDTSLSTTSTNPVENRIITNALNGKQNVLTAGNHIDITNDVISAEGFQEELTAGDNVTISTETESDMRGPCPMGFHIPTQSEINIIYGVEPVNLKIPFTGYRDNYGNLTYNGIVGATWTCTPSGDNASYEYLIGSGVTRRNSMPRTCAYCIRPFKDTPVIPDSSWASITSDIKRNPSLGLISLTNDGGNTWITLSDKNAGATIVYDTADPMTDANCGYMYQWGNNHPFSCFGSISTTSGTVDASGYGPGNYYDNSAYIRGDYWDSSNNGNLRGGISQGIHLGETRISATDTTYTAGSGISIDQNNEISNTAQPTVVSDDSGVTYHITVSNSDPTSGTASNIITLVV